MTNIAIQDIPSSSSIGSDSLLGVHGGAAKLLPLSSLAVGFSAAGVGAQQRLMQDVIREQPGGALLTNYHDPVLDGSDYSPALRRALAVNKIVYIPAGTFNFATPVDYNGISGFYIVGAAPLYASSTDGATVCIANAGFLTNSTTTRQTMFLQNLHIKGNGTAGTIGIGGPFSGTLLDTKVENYPICVNNLSSYLSRYIRSIFKFCTTGLMLADTNGVHVEDCHFDSSCGTAVDNVTGTPLTGGNTGNPLIIRGCNVNCGNQYFTNNSKFHVRGNVIAYGNYFEDFSATGPSGIVFFDYVAGRFDDMGLLFYGNELNGQGHAAIGVRVGSSTAGQSAPANGAIYSNRIIGFVTGPIVAATDNNVQHLRVYDNGPQGTAVISNLSPAAVYRPIADLSWTTVTNVTSTTTYADLPIAQTVGFDNGGGTGIISNAYRCRKAGIYQLTAEVVLRNNTTSALPAIEVHMTSAGTEVAKAMANLPIASAGTPAYTTVTLTAVLNVVANTDIKVQARNGEGGFSGHFNAVFLGNGFS